MNARFAVPLALVWIVCAPSLSQVPGQTPPPALVVEGQPTASIVLRTDATKREETAAQEIQHYVRKASGATLPIVRGGDRPSGNRIVIEIRSPPKGGSSEAFTITTDGGSARIVGNSPLAALYGAYEWLEQGLGVRWYLPGELGEVVPKQKTIVLPKLNVSCSPSFPMRWIGRGEWAVRNRQNRCDDGFVIHPGIYHTQNALLPHREYFKEHPDYFALVKGARSAVGDCKLCTSNPAVVAEVARNMARMLDEKPEIALISLSPTDGMLYCECEKCKAQDEPDARGYQKMSRRMLLFYNAVAAELRKTHPNAKMLVGAYHVYTQPPKDTAIKADPMINVIICHYESYCLAHSVADPNCSPNGRYRDLINAWQDLGCNVYFYEYYYKVNWMDLPWPIAHSIKQDMAWYKQQGVQGVYTQYSEDNVWTLFPGYYVAARLLWDASADADAIMAKMCDDLFGKAAPAMKAYYAMLEERMATCGKHIPGGGLSNGPLVFSDEMRAAMRREYERASKLNDDPNVAKRLEKISFSLEYVDRLMYYAKLMAATTSRKNPSVAAAKAAEARDFIAALNRELLADRKKWDGVVDRSLVAGAHYLAREQKRMAELAATLADRLTSPKKP